MAVLSLRLLLDVILGTALLRLALGTHLLVVGLASLVTRDAREGAADGTLGAASEAGAKVAELALGLLLLALEVLLAAGLL